MARNRTISPDFWTCEAVIDCKPMTRLLFLGLWTFADDFGVQPLRPRTIAMQVFPGDRIDGDAVRAMLDELAAQRLVHLYEVDGVAYVAVVDWNQLQRVGKRARRRYPSAASTVPGPSQTIEIHRNRELLPLSEAGEQPSRTIENHSNGSPPPFGGGSAQPARTRANQSITETPDDRSADRRTATWIAEGRADAGCLPADWREADARLHRIAAPA